MCLTTSNCAALCLGMIWSAIFFSSELNFLKRSSKSRDKSWEGQKERQGCVSITKPPISHIKLPFPSDSDSRNRPSGHVMPASVSNQRRAAITIRINNQVCPLTDKNDLASVPGPIPPPPDTQEVTSLINTPPHILTYIKNKQAALFRVNKEIKLSLCSQAN